MKKSFTMAEVLITLTIIGVIAALTIPNLMRKYEDHQTVAAVKRAYSILSNAYKMAIAQNGPYSDWPFDEHSIDWGNKNIKAKNIIANLKTKALVYQTCASSNRNAIGAHKDLSNTYNAVVENIGGCYFTDYAVLEDGSRMSFLRDNGTAPGMDIHVDINGLKGPNRLGLDTFTFCVPDNGTNIRPGTCNGYNTSNSCKMKDGSKWGYNGTSCSVWIMKHGNMDYKYHDVSTEW